MSNFLVKSAAAFATFVTISVPAMAVEQARPAAGITRAQVQAKVQERFTAADANRDGAVTRAEFDAQAAKMKAERTAKRGERRAERFGALDTDRNGQLSRDEFLAQPDRGAGKDGMRGHGGRRGMHGWRGMGRGGEGAFVAMDANKDGRVTLAEASARPLAMFDRADTDKNGTVTPEERRAARDAMRAAWQARRG